MPANEIPLPSDVPALQPASIAASVRDAAAVIDPAGRVVGWNAAAEARWGVPSTEAVGRPLAELGLTEPGGPADVVRLPLTGHGQGALELVVWPGTRAALSPEALELHKARALGSIAGSISHELTNTLGQWVTYSSLVESDPGVPADLIETLALCRSETDRGGVILSALLELVRTRPPAVRPTEIGSLVREIIALESRLAVNLDVRIAIADDLPEVAVDPALLRQALLALTLDAFAAMGGENARGRLSIRGEFADGPGGGAIRIIVEDGGPVVPEGERRSLFEPVAGAGRTRGGGRGDLAVAAQLVAACGARVWHQPLPDGNRFVVELPVGAAARVPAGGFDVPREPAPPPGTGPVEPRPITVLVCDDEQPIRSLLVRVLDKAGIRTLAAGSGMEALDLLEAAHVDAVVTDHFMAGMTGTELCERAIAMRPSLAGHVAVMSGDAGNTELVAFARKSGVTILAKPFDNTRLPELIRALART